MRSAHGRYAELALDCAPQHVAGWPRRRPMGLASERSRTMILQDQTKPSHDDLAAMVERLKAENAALRAGRPQPGVSFKVSEKGAVSIYGLQRFPVTLYVGQLDKLRANVDKLWAFVEANRSVLKTKD